jgi:hypothetical protein
MQTPNLRLTDLSTPANTNAGIPTISASDHPSVLADIYQDANNIAIWQRDLPPALKSDLESLLALARPLQIALSVTPENCLAETTKALRDLGKSHELIEDISRLVALFCSLFELKHTALKLATIDQVMCPRFHVDNVPCRLVSTYVGQSTQWLPDQVVDRRKLGRGNNGLPDELSGIYRHVGDIQQLTSGDVALLKGAQWEGNEHGGLVHRSPTPKPGETRLLLTLDFVSKH